MLLLTLLLSLSAPQSVAAGDAAERIAGLIESTNRLEHFSAVYHMQRDGQQAEFRIDYLAPDSIRWRVSSPEQFMSTAIDGKEIWMATTGGESGAAHGATDWLDRGGALEEAQTLLAELAPLGEEIPRVFVRLDWSVDAETDKTDLSFSVGKTMYGDMPLLGWLDSCKQRQEELALVNGELVHESERVRVAVDAGTGFLTELRAVGKDDSVMELTLQSLDLDSAPGREVFMQPKVDEGAKDISADLGNLFRSRTLVRTGGLHRFHAMVESGRRDLDDDLLEDLKSFTLALHRPQLQAWFTPNLERMHKEVSEYGKYLSSSLAGGVPIETLEEQAAGRRQALETWVAKQRSERLGDLPAEPASMADSQTWQQLRAAEDEIYLGLFDELFGDLVLADFDDAVADALGS